MRVLDIGCGAGDVSFLAAELVGPAGAVVGVDLNEEVLMTARERASAEGLENVTFMEGDFRTATLASDFDAVVGRLVLQYTGDLSQSVRQAAHHVRPGGIVLFEEHDFTLTMAYVEGQDKPFARRLTSLTSQLFERAGIPASAGLGLLRAFVEADLGIPTMSAFTPLGGAADWPGYQLYGDGIRSLVPLFEQFGLAAAEEFDVGAIPRTMYKEVEATLLPATVGTQVSAWARKKAVV
jgi:SAM-dependent methyltransferase